DRETATADEGDQGRRVDRPLDGLARNPGPTRTDLGPATIVEGREAPGCVVDPGPAPGWNEGPMAIAIGRPTRLDGRIPDRAVLGRAIPVALAREIIHARHILRHVVRRLDDLRFLLVAPAVDVLRLRLRTAADHHAEVVADRLRTALEDRDAARPAVGAGIDAIPSGRGQRDRARRRRDLIAL